jgi:thiamine biosynthesis lipoprotein
MTSSLRKIERARPLLGTYVAICVHGLRETDAHRAIDDAFAEIALVHRLMSFHEAESDVSRLNREAYDRSIAVHAATFEVLRWAQEIAQFSVGVFDVTIAPELIRSGVLPAHHAGQPSDPLGNWRDIGLAPGNRVRFHRRFCIDLGGIAKGYAVDLAVEKLHGSGVAQACVNAGGDLAIFGPDAERVRLSAEITGDTLPVLEIENVAVASSANANDGQVPHLDGRTRRAVSAGRFVSVVAERCIIADALTKIVFAWMSRASPFAALRSRGASHAGHGWRHLGAREPAPRGCSPPPLGRESG